MDSAVCVAAAAAAAELACLLAYRCQRRCSTCLEGPSSSVSMLMLVSSPAIPGALRAVVHDTTQCVP